MDSSGAEAVEAEPPASVAPLQARKHFFTVLLTPMSRSPISISGKSLHIVLKKSEVVVY
jgi:hypothetical protein